MTIEIGAFIRKANLRTRESDSEAGDSQEALRSIFVKKNVILAKNGMGADSCVLGVLTDSIVSAGKFYMDLFKKIIKKY